MKKNESCQILKADLAGWKANFQLFFIQIYNYQIVHPNENDWLTHLFITGKQISASLPNSLLCPLSMPKLC